MHMDSEQHVLDVCSRMHSSNHWHLISVTLQRGDAAFSCKWLDKCVPKGAAAQGGPNAGDAAAPHAAAPPHRRGRERT